MDYVRDTHLETFPKTNKRKEKITVSSLNKLSQKSTIFWTTRNLTLVRKIINAVMQRIHTDEKLHQCSQCEKSYSSKNTLNTHLKKHTGEIHQCKDCNKSFSQRSSLTRHLKIHSGEKPHQCNQCDTAFFRKSSLLNHLRKHTGEKPYHCSECDFSFQGKDHLTRHLKNHAIVKSYFKSHLTKRNREKPYSCSQCDISFSRKYHLTRHLQTHTGEKQFQCKYCEKAYSRNSHLISHLTKHHGDKDKSDVKKCKMYIDVNKLINSKILPVNQSGKKCRPANFIKKEKSKPISKEHCNIISYLRKLGNTVFEIDSNNKFNTDWDFCEYL